MNVPLTAITASESRIGAPPWSPASAHLWALVSGYPSHLRANKFLAFLQAFVDDSASEVSERRLFLAGYLNRAEKWALFADAWHEELTTTPAIDYLKMAEAQNRRDQFNGWERAAIDEKLGHLARVVRHFKPLSFECSISRESFKQILGSVSPRGINPHFTASWGVICAVVNYVASEGATLPIDFIFDTQEGVEEDIKFFFDYMKRGLPSRSRRLLRNATIFRDEKIEFVPLQAADMLAWHLRRDHEMAPRSLPMAGLLRNPNGHLVCDGIDEALMRRWSEHHRNLPGITRLQGKTQWQNTKRTMRYLSSLGVKVSYADGWYNRIRRAISNAISVLWRKRHKRNGKWRPTYDATTGKGVDV